RAGGAVPLGEVELVDEELRHARLELRFLLGAPLLRPDRGVREQETYREPDQYERGQTGGARQGRVAPRESDGPAQRARGRGADRGEGQKPAQVLRQGFDGRIAAVGILLERRETDRLEVARDERVDPAQERRLPARDLAEHLGARRALEGPAQGQ